MTPKNIVVSIVISALVTLPLPLLLQQILPELAISNAFIPVWAAAAVLAAIASVLGLFVNTRVVGEEDDENDTRELGQVKWFNVNKGFGFVTRENGEDVFVHFRAIRGKGHRTLVQGQKVRFHVIQSDKGLQAEDVSILRS
ncbi:cold-shock protein [Pokkaliibacter plantistimulans]|uniref:Cold-shock protein n=1 Tax=Proteobacteria bacterium 228 TaxID=2083153 RepID=A0A2S5KW91_9PROT|nr:cold-shock protein [Pokkaliibacter plantistimulans]PPC79040.1 cold-shock protein [Pokkaliibacter plantistimulans]